MQFYNCFRFFLENCFKKSKQKDKFASIFARFLVLAFLLLALFQSQTKVEVVMLMLRMFHLLSNDEYLKFLNVLFLNSAA